jgi:hypothetical protein
MGIEGDVPEKIYSIKSSEKISQIFLRKRQPFRYQRLLRHPIDKIRKELLQDIS